ncbi:MAG: hypothetical protein HFI39_14595 [Lachnospiraceae bacterium]|nr:hypothetical protein [Lachnospiraceae bacterium]
MKRFCKKMWAAAAVFVLAVSLLAGCGSAVKPEAYATTPVATVGEETIYLDEANFYLRSDQYYYEMMYSYMYGTSDIWNMEVSTGVTMADDMRESVLATLRQTYILCSHADELGVSLSEADLAKVEETIDSSLEQSDPALLERINMDRERMVEIMTKNALANRVWEAVVAAADTNVSDEEARCVGASYVLVAEKAEGESQAAEETQAEGEEAASPKVMAQEIYDAVRGGSTLADAAALYALTPSSATYFIGDTFDAGTLGAHALALAEGESELFKVDGTGWYVMVLDSEMDEAATNARRESIIAQRQAEVFNETYPAWQEAVTFTVDEKVWKAVPFDTIFVIPTAEETTAGEETTAAQGAGEETTAPAQSEAGGETAAGEDGAQSSAAETTAAG